MAMIPCKECGRDLSARAISCPSCGAPTGPGPGGASSPNMAAPAPTAATAAAVRPRSMRTIYRVLVAFAALWFIATAFWLVLPAVSRVQLLSTLTNWNRPNEPSADAGRTLNNVERSSTEAVRASRRVYQTTAEQLYQDYNANAVATQSKIGAGRVRISGTVAEIDEDAAGHPVVKLWAGAESRADLRLNDDQRAAAAALVKGENIDIECDKMQHTLTAPQGSACTLVLVNSGYSEAYLAVVLSETKGKAPIYIVGPMPRAACVAHGDRISAQLVGNSRHAQIVSRNCTATAQESLPPTGDCQLGSLMRGLPDLPTAHLWKYECGMHEPMTSASLRHRTTPIVAAAARVESEVDGASAAPSPPSTSSAAADTRRDAAAPVVAPATPSVGSDAAVLAGAGGVNANAGLTVAPASEPPTAAAGTGATAETIPSDLMSVKDTDPTAADRIASYCNNVTAAAANRDSVAAGCRRAEAAAWNRFVVQNEFPTLDEGTRRKCNEPPFPDSYVAKEACAKYQLRVN